MAQKTKELRNGMGRAPEVRTGEWDQDTVDMLSYERAVH